MDKNSKLWGYDPNEPEKLAGFGNRGREVHLLFVDLSRASDNVPITNGWKILDGKHINVHSRFKIKLGNELSDCLLLTKDLRQGCNFPRHCLKYI